MTLADPYLLTETPAVSDESFNRPLAVLYAIGTNALAAGFKLHHHQFEGNTIKVPLDVNGALGAPVVGPVRSGRGNGIVVPTSGRTANTFPHLGADPLNKFLFADKPGKSPAAGKEAGRAGRENRAATLSALTEIDGDEANAFRAFLVRLFDLATRTKPQAVFPAKEGKAPELLDPILLAFIELTGIEVTDTKQKDALANALLLPVSGMSGSPFAGLLSWQSRHIEAVRANLEMSNEIGTCSITGGRVALLSTMPNSVSSTLKGLTGRPSGSAVISGNKWIVSGRATKAGIHEARIGLDAGEKIAIGLAEMSVRCELSMLNGGYRSTVHYGPVNKNDRPSLVVLLTMSGDDPARRLLVGLRNALTSIWIKDSTDADGNRVKGRYGTVGFPDVAAGSRIVAAAMNGSKAGVSLTRWAERDAHEIAERLYSWSAGQDSASLSIVWPVDRIARCFAAGAVGTFTRFLLDDEPLPSSLIRFAIGRLAHVFATGELGGTEPERRIEGKLQKLRKTNAQIRRELTGSWLITVALHVHQNQRKDPMTGLRDTPAFRLGAWFAALQQAWEGSVNKNGDKQSAGPARHLSGLLDATAERWIQVETQYQRAVVPLLRGDSVGLARLVERRATAFLELDADIPAQFDETDQCRFLLGFHSRWEHKKTELPETKDPLAANDDNDDIDTDETDGETE
jgi:CRISPR-associated protein (Cas_Csd1)